MAKTTAHASPDRHTVWHMSPIPESQSTMRIRHARGEARGAVTQAAAQINKAAAKRGVVDVGSATDEEVERDRADRAAWLRGRRGRPPQSYVEFLVAGPPQYGSDAPWPVEQEFLWASAAVDWVKKRFPHSVIAAASIHRDETAPHLHIVLSPQSLDSKGQRQWGWCHARNQAVQFIADEFQAAKAAASGKRKPRKRKPFAHLNKTNAKKALSIMQNDCHAHVGEPFGLLRGERGSKAKHQAVDKMTAAIGHVREVAKSVAASRRKAAQFSKRLAQRERRIQAVETEQGAMAEREAEVAAQAEQIATAAEELAHFQQQMRQLAESLHRRQRAAQRKEEVNEKKQAENADKERRILVSMACMTHASTCVISDFDRWQELAHQALIGSPDDVDEIEAIVEPEPEPPPPTPPRKTGRKRRRRKPSNVVDFRPQR